MPGVGAPSLAAPELGILVGPALGPPETVAAPTDEDGTPVYGSGCPPGGTVDPLIEPCRTPPWPVALGTMPVSEAIAAHASLAGFQVATPTALAFGNAAEEFEGADIARLNIGPEDFVVVASQGAGDLACARAAPERSAARVSTAASRRKTETPAGKLIAEGFRGIGWPA